MKAKYIILSLLLSAPLLAADMTGVLLKGTIVNAKDCKVSGTASAIVGDTKVSADTITYDSKINALRCEGEVSIQTSIGVVRSKDCVVEFGAAKKKVFFFTPEGVKVEPAQQPGPTR